MSQWSFMSDDEKWAACEELRHRAYTAEQLVHKYEAAIRRHRDYRGDDRCHLDDRELYVVLPEGYEPPAFDTEVTIEQCQRFIACRRDPATTYVSPQRKIEELESEVARLRQIERDWLSMQKQEEVA